MNRLATALGMLVLYLCLGVVLGGGVAGYYLWSQGFLTPEKLQEMAAIMRDFTPPEVKRAAEKAKEVTPTLAEVARSRAALQRDMELREQALRNRADQLRVERENLITEVDRYTKMRIQFDQELAALREDTLGTHVENALTIFETMKPRQAKEQLLRMLDTGDMDEAVSMLSSMSVAKRAKVIAEFRTDEENRRLADVLKRIREGEPELKRIDSAAARVNPDDNAPSNNERGT